jgi:selenocysteine lyase/cysteine desulfurase
MIHLDNASTTFPKPECVYAETMERFRGYGVSPSRGCYSAARKNSVVYPEWR